MQQPTRESLERAIIREGLEFMEQPNNPSSHTNGFAVSLPSFDHISLVKLAPEAIIAPMHASRGHV